MHARPLISFRRVALGALALAALAGCGFTPLLSESAHPGAQENLERIRIATIPDRSGQILRNHLLDALTPRGRARGPELYVLTITLSEPRREIAIRRDDTVSRLAYAATISFRLTDRAQRLLFSGSSASETTYEVTNSEFATLSSLTSARDRALQEVSLDVRQQLAAFFAGYTRNPP